MFFVETVDCRPHMGGRPYGHPLVAIAFLGAVARLLRRRSRGSRSTRQFAMPNDQPVLAIGGLFVDVAHPFRLSDNSLSLNSSTSWLTLSLRFAPNRIPPEISGAAVRSTEHVESQGNEGMQSASSTESSVYTTTPHGGYPWGTRTGLEGRQRAVMGPVWTPTGLAQPTALRHPRCRCDIDSHPDCRPFLTLIVAPHTMPLDPSSRCSCAPARVHPPRPARQPVHAATSLQVAHRLP